MSLGLAKQQNNHLQLSLTLMIMAAETRQYIKFLKLNINLSHICRWWETATCGYNKFEMGIDVTFWDD